MFGETTISYVKIGNHPIETTIYKWLFEVPGSYQTQPFQCFFSGPNFATNTIELQCAKAMSTLAINYGP